MGEAIREVRILIVDDHVIVREGLREVLEGHPGFRVVGEAGDGREAIAAAERLVPDVAVMDLQLPRLSGIAAAREIARVSPATYVVILSVQEGVLAVEEALRAGAAGYVVKRAASTELVAALEAAVAGKKYLSPEVAEGLLERVTHPHESGAGPLAALTSREREILRWVAEGLTAKEIAENLSISVRTAETHRSNVMRKLGVSKTAGLVRIAIREGLVAL